MSNANRPPQKNLTNLGHKIGQMPSEKQALADPENVVFPTRVVPSFIKYDSHQQFATTPFHIPEQTPNAARISFERKFMVVAERNTASMGSTTERVGHCKGWQPTLRTAIELADWCCFTPFYRWARVFYITSGHHPRLMHAPISRLEAPEEFTDYNPDR